MEVSADHSFVSLGDGAWNSDSVDVSEVSADHSFVSLGDAVRRPRRYSVFMCRLIIPSSAWATEKGPRLAEDLVVSADHSFVSLGDVYGVRVLGRVSSVG